MGVYRTVTLVTLPNLKATPRVAFRFGAPERVRAYENCAAILARTPGELCSQGRQSRGCATQRSGAPERIDSKRLVGVLTPAGLRRWWRLGPNSSRSLSNLLPVRTLLHYQT